MTGQDMLAEQGQISRALVSVVLVLCVVTSALAVTFVAQKNRHLFNDLEQLRRKETALEAEWTRLLLERSTLASHSRIEKMAVEELGLRSMQAKDVVIVK
ncbi:MAG: cell division protein FtsL [Pseudomonadales bacterium]